MSHALYAVVSVAGICLLLLILFSQRRMTGSTDLQRQFNRLVYVTIVMLVIDAMCWLLEGSAFLYAREWKRFAETTYFFLLILIPFLWVVYVEFTLSEDRESTLRRVWLLAIPLVLLTAYLFVNLRAFSVFLIDEANCYHRMMPGLVYPITAYAYLTFASVRVLLAARHAGWRDEKRRYYVLAFFLVPPAIGGLVQIFCYGVSSIWIFVAISIMIMYIDTIIRQISIDPLTGINNRRELTKYILRMTREPAFGGVLALIMMDVDDFKRLNDTCGHYYGDGALIKIAGLLKHACKNTEAFLARCGGDEFCIVYPAESTDVVDRFITEIQANISRWNQENDEPFSLSLSIGYAVWEPEMGGVDELYRQADQMMYRIKNAKKTA